MRMGALRRSSIYPEGAATSKRKFPAYRVIWYLTPGVILFLFFPFRLVQWISILAVLFLLISYTASYLLFRGISIAAGQPSSYGYPHDSLVIEFRIENPSLFPAVNLGVSVFTPSPVSGQQKQLGLLTVSGRSAADFAIAIRMDRRGEYDVAPVVLQGSDPWSIFPWRIVHRDIARLVIYPSIYHGGFTPSRGIAGGSIRVFDRMYADVNSIGSIRDYVPGDDIRRIHWKASAKSGELKTSQLLPTMDAPVVVMLDFDSATYPQRYRYSFIERAIEIAASVVYTSGERHQRVGLVSNGLDGDNHPIIPPSGRTASSWLALRVLARIGASQNARDPVSLFLDARIAIQPGMTCVVVSPKTPSLLSAQLTHPTIAALSPIYFHVSDKPEPANAALRIKYRFAEKPQEMFIDVG